MDKLELIDELEYIFGIISSVSSQKFTVRDFCKKWYDDKLHKKYETPEDALYELFCDKMFETFTMHIPDLPIISSKHKNNFEGDVELDNNWGCINCSNCSWCINCTACVDCDKCVKCNDCRDCISCNDCHNSEFLYSCKHIIESRFLANTNNISLFTGSCDSNCNWNCSNCESCMCCIDCENCTDVSFAHGCENCKNINQPLRERIQKIFEEKNNNSNVHDLCRFMMDIYELFDRLGMLSYNCKSCTKCNYLCDGYNEFNETIDIDPCNEEYIDHYLSKKHDKAKVK